MRNKIVLTLVLGTLAFSPATTAAEEETDLLEFFIEMADTNAEHAALAAHFRKKAAEARAEAASHKRMMRIYGGRSPRSVGGSKIRGAQRMKEHWEKIAANEEAAAAEFDALAKLHEEESKQSQ